MNVAKKIATNTTFILTGNIVVKLLALFVSVYLARYLGVEYFGEYNFVITYLVIRVVTSIFSIILAVLLIWLLGYPNETILYVSVLSVILLFQGVSYLFESVFNANLKMYYSAIGLIVSKVFYSAAAFVLMYLNKSLIDFLYLYIVAEMIRAAISIYYSRNFVSIKLNIDWELWIIYYRIDILMLSKMEGNFAVGLYSAAYRMVDPILFLPSALASTLIPLMSKEYVNNLFKFKQLYSSGSKYILLLMFPITITLFLFSEHIIHLIYTEDYFPAVITFKILSLTLVFNSVNSIQNSVLIASDKQKINMMSVGICCVLNVILNLVLIPVYSYNGAAIATLISVLALFAIQLLFIRQSLSIIFFNKESYGIFISSLLMGIFIYLFSDVGLIVLISASISIYFLLLYATKSFSNAELLMIRQFLKKK